MSKSSTITNLIVMPLIASAVFLASPAMASNSPLATHKEVRNITGNGTPNTKKGIAGTVTSINGNILIVTSRDNTEYTVDAGSATIMKAGSEGAGNPSIAHIADIKMGDMVMVRGVIKDSEISALNIFDGKMDARKAKHFKHSKAFSKMHPR
jgi:hypothetical protein